MICVLLINILFSPVFFATAPWITFWPQLFLYVRSSFFIVVYFYWLFFVVCFCSSTRDVFYNLVETKITRCCCRWMWWRWSSTIRELVGINWNKIWSAGCIMTWMEYKPPTETKNIVTLAFKNRESFAFLSFLFVYMSILFTRHTPRRCAG